MNQHYFFNNEVIGGGGSQNPLQCIIWGGGGFEKMKIVFCNNVQSLNNKILLIHTTNFVCNTYSSSARKVFSNFVVFPPGPKWPLLNILNIKILN